MRKNTHPLKNESVIVLNNGSTLLKKWVFFKKIIRTDFDYLNNPLWNLKKISKKK